MRGCATREALGALLEERLDDAEKRAVEAHVECCPLCQSRLEELTGQCLLEWKGTFLGFRFSLGSPSFSPKGKPMRTRVPASQMPSTLHVDDEEPRQTKRRNSEKTVEDFGDLPKIEGYETLSVLGQGGMGVVYKAKQRSLNRLVAVKMIRPDGTSRTEHLARLRLEAETVAHLCHPNIVQVYDVGEANGLPFVCLELLEGGSLSDRTADAPQPPRNAATMAATLALAVHEAHRAGFVHRDLKPANVLFALDGTPKITDFGLAKRFAQDDGQTRTGQVVGSPSYMAPEQAKGKPHPIGPAADIYALGAILYQLLTGRPPFEGSTPVETVLQVIGDEPVPPSKLQSRIPRDLETICLKCLRKDPRQRYGSAEELASELSRFLAGEPIQARPTPLWERGWKWARRRPVKAMATGLMILGCFCLTVSVPLHWHHQRLEEQRLADCRVQSELLLLRADEARQHNDWQKSELLLTNLQTALRNEPRLFDLYEKAESLLTQSRQQEHTARLVQREQRRFDEFRSLCDTAMECDAEFAAFDRAANLRLTRKAATAALEVYGSHSTGQWHFQEVPLQLPSSERSNIVNGIHELLLVLAEATARPLPGEDAKDQAKAALAILDQAAQVRTGTRALYQRRADYWMRLGNREEAVAARSQAEQLQPSGAFEHFLCGMQHYKRRDFSAAIACFETVAQLQPDHFWAQCLLGVCTLQEQHPAEAVAIFTACLRQKPHFWPLYLFRGTAYGEVGRLRLLGNVKNKLGDSDEHSAERAFELAEADFATAFASELQPTDRYRVLASRGLSRLRAGRLDEAAQDLREAIHISPQPYSPHRTLAQVYAQLGHHALADKTLTHAISLDPNVADLYRTRAQYVLDRPDQTAARCERALADLNQAIALEAAVSPRIADDHARRGLLLAKMNRFHEALEACDQSLSRVPMHADARRLQVALQLQLKQYDKVIDSANTALKGGAADADLYEIRGLAKAASMRHDYGGAIEDYTFAIRLRPDSARLYCLRGWAYLFADAAALAVTDFSHALRLEPNKADALNGRGFSLARLGKKEEAEADAESAVRYGDGKSRTLYNTSRIYAQLATIEAAKQRHTPEPPGRYEIKIRDLLTQALSQLSPESKTQFWHDVIEKDDALKAVRQQTWFACLDPREDTPVPKKAVRPVPSPENADKTLN